MGYGQLTKISHIINERKRLYKEYLKQIRKLDHNILTQKIDKECNFVPWTFAVRINNSFKFSRDQLIKKFIKNNIETRNGFYSPNNLVIFEKSKIKNSDLLSKEVICLPIHLNMKIKDVYKIISTLKEYLKKYE